MSSITVNLENLNDNEREQLTALIEKANKPKKWEGPKGDLVIHGDGDKREGHERAPRENVPLYALVRLR
jgi:tRNA(Ser,Leu) C12 N-acetylase TAN1